MRSAPLHLPAAREALYHIRNEMMKAAPWISCTAREASTGATHLGAPGLSSSKNWIFLGCLAILTALSYP